MRTQPFSLPGAASQLIHGDLYIPAADRPPLVIVIHGFKGFKDWGFFPWLGARLAESGLAAACINLSHCGIGSGATTFDRLDLFERDTWSKRVYDIRQVLDAAHNGAIRVGHNPARLGLLGHSMGGGAALLAAADDARVRSLVTLACVASPNRVPEDLARKQLALFGHVGIENARTKQLMPIGRTFFEELWERPRDFDILAAARRNCVPWLIVHGADDETVPLNEAYQLAEAAAAAPVGEEVKMLILDGAGHTFGATHPFARPTRELERAADAAAAHFLRTL